MRKQTAVAALALFVLGGLVPRAAAVELTVRPVITDLQNLDFSSYDPAHITAIGADGRLAFAEGAPPVVLVIEYYLGISELSGAPFELGFGNVALDLLPVNLSIVEATGGWNPDPTIIDINGELPEGETLLWSDNGDIGPDGTDLQSIVVGLAPASFGDPTLDARYTIGQDSDASIGSTYMTWDPAVSASAGLDVNIQAFSTYGADMRLRRRPLGVEVTGDLKLVVSPGLTGDTDKDGDVDLDDLNNVRNHFDETGENILGDTAPYDGVVDLNDLNRVHDNFGETIEFPGSLTNVPEPSTLGMLAVFAMAGTLLRRRFVNR